MECCVFVIKTQGDGEIVGVHAQRKEKRGEGPRGLGMLGRNPEPAEGQPRGGGASSGCMKVDSKLVFPSVQVREIERGKQIHDAKQLVPELQMFPRVIIVTRHFETMS